MATSRPAETPGAVEAVGGLCKLALDLRIVAVTLTVFWLMAEGRADQPALVLPLMAASLASFVAVMRWERLGRRVLLRPGYLAAEIVLAGYLLARTGTGSPFLYFTLATALLAGAIHGWRGAAVFSVLLMAAAWAANWIDLAGHREIDDFQGLVVVPALYPSFAAAGAALRRLLVRQEAQAAALTEAAACSAAADERARLARDVHDSVAKTLYGIALSATALAETAASRPHLVPVAARQVASAARLAAGEARSLIDGLRAVPGGDEPLSLAVRRVSLAWGERTQIDIGLSVQPIELVCPVASLEVVRILEEALTNVERYAVAATVTVGLRCDGDEAVLSVADDGGGFVVPESLEELGRTGHYGLLGAAERAARAGGRLLVRSAPGRGTTVTTVVPIRRGLVDLRGNGHVVTGSSR